MQNDKEEHDLLTVKRDAFWQLWKKRGLLVLALLLLLIPLYGTFSPLFEFILFAVSLAALTYPVFFRPIESIGRKLLPSIDPRRRSELCAVLATISLLLIILSPFLLIIWEASNPNQGMLDTILSLALGEEEGREALLQSISARIREIHAIYPRLPLDEEKAVQFVSNLVGDTREFSGTFWNFCSRELVAL